MKSYDIIGYVCDGAMYCPDCAPSTESPIFAQDGQSGDYCDECLAVYLKSLEDVEPRYRYPASTNAPWVFLDGCEPETKPEEDSTEA